MKMHLRGVVGFFGPFFNPGCNLFQKLEYVSNSAARIVDGFPMDLNARQVLRATIETYDLDVQVMLAQSIVRRIGHVFRQADTDLKKLFEFNWNDFSQSKRVSNGRGAFSPASLRMSNILGTLGIQFEGAGSGGIGTRNNLGAPCRYWYPWFVSMRDQEGLGWCFEKNDRQRISERVQLLVKLFVRERTARQPAILDLPFLSRPLPLPAPVQAIADVMYDN